VSLSKHGVTDVRDEVLAHLRQIARASTVDDFDAAVHTFKLSSVWREHKALEQWFESTWLPERKVCMSWSRDSQKNRAFFFYHKYCNTPITKN